MPQGQCLLCHTRDPNLNPIPIPIQFALTHRLPLSMIQGLSSKENHIRLNWICPTVLCNVIPVKSTTISNDHSLYEQFEHPLYPNWQLNQSSGSCNTFVSLLDGFKIKSLCNMVIKRVVVDQKISPLSESANRKLIKTLNFVKAFCNARQGNCTVLSHSWPHWPLWASEISLVLSPQMQKRSLRMILCYRSCTQEKYDSRQNYGTRAVT